MNTSASQKGSDVTAMRGTEVQQGVQAVTTAIEAVEWIRDNLDNVPEQTHNLNLECLSKLYSLKRSFQREISPAGIGSSGYRPGFSSFTPPVNTAQR